MTKKKKFLKIAVILSLWVVIALSIHHLAVKMYNEGVKDGQKALVQQAREAQKNADIDNFEFVLNGKEFMRFSKDGNFYIADRKVANDQDIFLRFKQLVTEGCPKP